MKIRIFSYLAALALAGHVAHAQTDPATIVAEAADNTFLDHNYSWRTITTLPDGAVHEVVGAKAGTNTLITRTMGNEQSQVLLTVGDKRFIQTDSGWKAAADVILHARRPERPLDRPIRVGAPRGGPFGDPSEQFDRILDRVSAWSVSGNTFVGSFEGAPFGPGKSDRGRAKGRADGVTPEVSTTLTVQVTNGIISSITSSLSGHITAPDEPSREVAHTSATTINAVGTTSVVVPADVQALLGSN